MESNNPSKDDMISSFCGITGVETERGQFYLESANWNLQLAIQSFFEHSAEDSVMNVNNNQNPSLAPTEDQQRAQQLQQMFSNRPMVETHSSDDDSSQEMSSPKATPKSAEKKPSKAPPRQTSSKFATLDSLRQQADSGGSSGEEEGQAFYAGGSERSGQQVLGPPRKKNPDEVVSNLFASAKEHGAEVVDPSEQAKAKKRVETFVGTGFKLGSNAEPSVSVASSSVSKRQTREVVLRLWRNGFTVDDGPLRSFEDPLNREFLGSIGRGEIPMELVHKYRSEEVHMNMEDKRNEEYAPPKRRLEAFAGEGHRLGNPTAEVISSAVQSNKDPKACEEEALKRLSVDEKKPTTNIRIQLLDGSRLVLKLNLTHTISQIRQFICDCRPSFATQMFALMTTFPNKELTDESLTIEAAKLMNAVIVQKAKT